MPPSRPSVRVGKPAEASEPIVLTPAEQHLRPAGEAGLIRPSRRRSQDEHRDPSAIFGSRWRFAGSYLGVVISVALVAVAATVLAFVLTT